MQQYLSLDMYLFEMEYLKFGVYFSKSKVLYNKSYLFENILDKYWEKNIYAFSGYTQILKVNSGL